MYFAFINTLSIENFFLILINERWLCYNIDIQKAILTLVINNNDSNNSNNNNNSSNNNNNNNHNNNEINNNSFRIIPFLSQYSRNSRHTGSE